MIMKDNVLLEKNYAFAVRSVRLFQWLNKKFGSNPLFDQYLRAGTSIGANAEEAIGGRSRADFKSCLGISYKEARESHSWLRLMRDTDYIEPNLANSMLKDCEEVLRIEGSILKTLKNKKG